MALSQQAASLGVTVNDWNNTTLKDGEDLGHDLQSIERKKKKSIRNLLKL